MNDELTTVIEEAPSSVGAECRSVSISVSTIPLLRSLDFLTAGHFYTHAAPSGAIAPAAKREICRPGATQPMRRRHSLCIWGILCLALLWLPFIQTVVAQDIVTTLAGQALVSGISNGFGTNALFSDPAAITVDLKGNLYLADSQNHAIRKIDSKGVVSTLAGQLGMPGSREGTGVQAQFDTPCGIALDQHGTLFVSDTGNHTVRKITLDGVVTRLAGLAGQDGFANGDASTALFSSPLGLAVATNGTVFVSDCGNHLIRAISPGGTVTTLAGKPGVWGSDDGLGPAARFNGPVGLALDDQGNLFVSDSNNHTVRKVTPDGDVSTWAGIAGVDGCRNGDARTATFCNPAELAIDRKNNLFVTDSFNHVIRMISRDRKVSTVSGVVGSSGTADGVNGQARFFNPYGIGINPDGSLIVADAYNQLIRVVLPPFAMALQTSGTNGTAKVFWSSVIGKAYQVQYKNPVDSGGWLNLGAPVMAVGLTASQFDNSLGNTLQRIYRVVIVP